MREPTIGDVLAGRYRLTRLIAAGGAGCVFEATDAANDRTLALKVPRTKWLGHPEVTERLLREAKALDLARHPNVVAHLDAGLTADGVPYLALELLRGRSLQGLLAARQRLPIADTISIGCQLCTALAFAHERGVIHRDVKPGNVYLAVDGRGVEHLKLLDFGVAAFRGAAAVDATCKLTQQGTLLGTAEYMAPEQLLAASDLDQRCDLYAVGVVLYECLTGAVPFDGPYGRVLLRAMTEPLLPLRSGRPEAPPQLERVIEQALARDREDRFATAAELGQALLAAVDVQSAAPTCLCFGQPGAAAELPACSTGVTRPAGSPPLPPAALSGAPTTPQQRRRHARAPYVTPVTVRRHDGRTVFGRTEDISEGGVLAITDERCAHGERVRVRFALPETGQFVELEAEARWERSGRGLAVAGFEFVALPDDARGAIRRYVARVEGAHGWPAKLGGAA